MLSQACRLFDFGHDGNVRPCCSSLRSRRTSPGVRTKESATMSMPGGDAELQIGQVLFGDTMEY